MSESKHEKYDFAINTLKDQIYIMKSFMRDKMSQHMRDGYKVVIAELKSAIKILKKSGQISEHS